MGHFPLAFLTEIFHICYQHVQKEDEQWAPQPNFWGVDINPLHAESNPICYLLALIVSHHILHDSGIRVNYICAKWAYSLNNER
jgi:hypothetical protein